MARKQLTEEQKAARRLWWENYRKTENGSEIIRHGRRKYYESAHGRAKVRAYQLAYTADPVKRKVIAEYGKRYRALPENAERRWRRDIVKKYGIDEGFFHRLLERQGGKCALCGAGFRESRPYVDHDHKTGSVRGLLHRKCNLLLGLANDSAEILSNGIKYLSGNFQ